MQDMSVFNIYMDKPVVLTDERGAQVQGMLTDLDTNGFYIDDEFVNAETITDVRYYGTLDMDTYEWDEGGKRLITPDNFTLSEADARRLVGEDFSFGEKILDYTAHLSLDASGNLFFLNDIECVCLRHAFCPEILKEKPFLYRIDGGAYLYAQYLENEMGRFLKTGDVLTPFDSAHITDITRCPNIGETVTVVREGAEPLISEVTSVSTRGLSLLSGHVGKLPFGEISSIRYTAAHRMDNDKQHRFGDYPVRVRYFRSATGRLYRLNGFANFEVGMTSRGLIAKDVVLDEEDRSFEGYGLLASYSNLAAHGFIGSSYSRNPDGKELFSGEYFLRKSVLPRDAEIDTHRFVYKVWFRYEELAYNTQQSCQKIITEIEIQEAFFKPDYCSITINEAGEISFVQDENPEQMRSELGESYGFLILYDTNKDFGYIANSYIAGAHTPASFEVKFRNTSPRFNNQVLDTRTFVYLVRYRYDKNLNRSERASSKKPLVYDIELLDALNRTGSYKVTASGEIYHPATFSALDDIIGARVIVQLKNGSYITAVLAGNDTERDCVVLSYGAAGTRDILYTEITDVHCLGRINRYQENNGYGNGIIELDGAPQTTLFFPEQEAVSGRAPKLVVGDLVTFRVETSYNNKTWIKKVCPLTETTRLDYVYASQNGEFLVLDPQQYETVPRNEVQPQTLSLLDPTVRLTNLDTRDCQVQVRTLQYEDGTTLVSGIEKIVKSLSKLFFGHIRELRLNEQEERCGYLDVLGSPEPLYFHQAHNPNLQSITIDTDEDLGLVSFRKAHDPKTGLHLAKQMTFLDRVQTVQDPSSASAAKPVREMKIDDIITECLKFDRPAAAREQLDEFADKTHMSEYDYNCKLYRILEKEVKAAKGKTPEEASAKRREALACIAVIRDTLDQTDAYGARLTKIRAQANLLYLEGETEKARQLYHEWLKLFREFTAIYPEQRANHMPAERAILLKLEQLEKNTPTSVNPQTEAEDPADDEPEPDEIATQGFADFFDWRVAVATENLVQAEHNKKQPNPMDLLWAKTIQPSLSADERRTARLEVCRAEAQEAREQGFVKKAQFFTFLHLSVDNTSDPLSTTVQQYFRTTATANDPLSIDALLSEQDLPSEFLETNGKHSPFVVDSVVLLARTSVDREAFVASFRNKSVLIDLYCRELCYLLKRKSQKTVFDIEQLNNLLTEAITYLDPPTERAQIQEYAEELDRKLKVLDKRWCIEGTDRIESTIQTLAEFGNRVSFKARFDCLRKSFNDLQAYRPYLQGEGLSVYGWGVTWKLCSRLIVQLHNSCKALCQQSEPVITVGNPRAERQADGTLKITLPLHNQKNKAEATNVTVSALDGNRALGSEKLYGNDRERPYVLYMNRETDTDEPIHLPLTITYRYVSGLDAGSNKKYDRSRQTETITADCLVHCRKAERPPLSLGVITTLADSAKRKMNTTTEDGKIAVEILKNRASDVDKILSTIAVGSAGDRHLRRNGRWVALYGQWRVGKTTLLYEIDRVLRTEEFRDQALSVCVTFGAGEQFESSTVSAITNAIKREARRCGVFELWQTCHEKWKQEHSTDVTDFRQLTELLQEFHEQPDSPCVVLALDEFTQIYEEIKNEHATPAFLNDFLYFISDSGCIVLTAGGEHTIALIKYDANMMQKADLPLEVRYLSESDTTTFVEKVISDPSYLGDEKQRERTIRRIYELTQGNAFLLCRFCQRLIEQVNKNDVLSLIDDLTIQETLDEIAKEDGVVELWFNSLYDPHRERGEEPDEASASRDIVFENVRDVNLRILNAIVQNAYPDTHTCERKLLKAQKAFKSDADFDRHLDTLIQRSIVEEHNGNLHIPIDMFYELQARTTRKDDLK